MILGRGSTSVPASERVGQLFNQMCGDHYSLPFVFGKDSVDGGPADAERGRNRGDWLIARMLPPRQPSLDMLSALGSPMCSKRASGRGRRRPIPAMCKVAACLL